MAKPQKKPGTRETHPKEPTNEVRTEAPYKRIPDFFEQAGAKAGWISAGIIAVVLLILFREYLFGSRIYMFKDIACDSYNLSYPYMNLYAEYIAKYGLPRWSFQSGMGQSIFPFFLRDPFDILIYLGGSKHINGLLAILEVLKIFLSGVTFYYFLKQLKITSISAMSGAMMFAFCGFRILWDFPIIVRYFLKETGLLSA